MNNDLHELDNSLSYLIAAEPSSGEQFSPSYEKYPNSFKKLIKSDVDTEREVMRVFRTYAKRADEFVNWFEFNRRVNTAAEDVVEDRESSIWNEWTQALAAALFIGLGTAVDAGGQHTEDELNINIGWSSNTHPAIEYLNNHVLNLVKGINATTEKRLRASLIRSIELGEDHESATRRLTGVIGDRRRAATIAHTETVRAYNGGRITVVSELGVNATKTWESIIDDRTSDICLTLSGVTIDFNKKFTTITGEEVNGPPAHVNCRSGLKIEIKK